MVFTFHPTTFFSTRYILCPLNSTVPPSIIEASKNIHTSAGQKVQIRCSAYGAPRPIITWIKNNVHITQANRYSVSSSGTLTIQDVGKADEGRYECVARNSIGAASAQMTLSVQSKVKKLYFTIYFSF